MAEKNQQKTPAEKAPAEKAPAAEAKKSAGGTAIKVPKSEAPNDPAETVVLPEGNPDGDTVDPPPAVMDVVTEDEVKEADTSDQVALSRLAARERQFPSLTEAGDGDAIEVAERTVDIDTASTGRKVAASTLHVKDFVTTRREWESEDQDAVHTRNMRAVRQYMVNQGIRPDAKVVVMDVEIGDAPRRGREDLAPVVLRYGVEAVPAAVAVGMEQVHTRIDQNQPTASQQALYEAGREERIRASHRALVGR